MGAQFRSQRLTVERLDIAGILEREALRQLAHISESDTVAPFRLADQFVERPIDVEALQRVIAPVMGDELERPLPAPGPEAVCVEHRAIRAVADDEPGRTKMPSPD